MSDLIRHFPSHWYTVVATPSEYHVDFKVYEIDGIGSDGAICWPRAEDEHPRKGPTFLLVEAELFLHGFVKWDGCSNWHFDEQDRVMLHECDRKGLLGIGQVMAACWDWAAELIPRWIGEP